MKIALIGYGKMGKTIERLAEERGHTVVLKVSRATHPHLSATDIRQAAPDVAIEFTSPHAAFHNITTCFASSVPVVSGSTAWLDRWDEAIEIMNQHDGSFVYASNFSIGVNIFFEINRQLAAVMGRYPHYLPQICETHHTSKVDSPSGTAVSLAEDMIANIPHLNSWTAIPDGSDKLLIQSIRQNPAPGTHEVRYQSPIDDIEIKHTAKSRDGFAAGALMAAEYILDKKGLHTMKDVLGM